MYRSRLGGSRGYIYRVHSLSPPFTLHHRRSAGDTSGIPGFSEHHAATTDGIPLIVPVHVVIFTRGVGRGGGPLFGEQI